MRDSGTQALQHRGSLAIFAIALDWAEGGPVSHTRMWVSLDGDLPQTPGYLFSSIFEF